jgi:adenylosuccinate lyase
MVQRSALTAIQEAAAVGQVGAQPGRFRALLGADPDVASRLDPAALDALFDLEHHLRHAPTIIDRALGDREPGKA